MIRPHLLLLVTFGLPLTGCATETSMTLAPPIAATFGQAAASSAPLEQNAQWWRLLKDPTLDRLIALAGVVCGRGRNPKLRLWPTIFSGKIDVFPGDRRSRLISSMTSVAPA